MEAAVRDALERLRRHPTRFRNFYDKLRRDFHRTARRQWPLSREDEIDEAVNEACVALFSENKGNFVADSTTTNDPFAFEVALTRYLVGASRFKLLTLLGKRIEIEALQVPLPDEDEEHDDVIDKMLSKEGAATDRHTLFASPEDSVEQQQRRHILERCLKTLSSLARETISLALRGHNDIEIQTHMGASSAVTIRRRVSEAKRLLIDCARKARGEDA